MQPTCSHRSYMCAHMNTHMCTGTLAKNSPTGHGKGGQAGTVEGKAIGPSLPRAGAGWGPDVEGKTQPATMDHSRSLRKPSQECRPCAWVVQAPTNSPSRSRKRKPTTASVNWATLSMALRYQQAKPPGGGGPPASDSPTARGPGTGDRAALGWSWSSLLSANVGTGTAS